MKKQNESLQQQAKALDSLKKQRKLKKKKNKKKNKNRQNKQAEAREAFVARMNAQFQKVCPNERVLKTVASLVSPLLWWLMYMLLQFHFETGVCVLCCQAMDEAVRKRPKLDASSAVVDKK